MADSVAGDYLKLLGGDDKARLALLACSAALRLDDTIARQIIELVAQSNGSSDKLVRKIKSLGCVWVQWDGSWYIAEDVRPHLAERLSKEVPAYTERQLRERLAVHADNHADSFSEDGQLTTYRVRQARFEAAYHRTLIPEQSQVGAAQLTELWRNAQRSAAEATAQSVDYLAPEMTLHLRQVPPEILFLQGMAARSRGDRRAQVRYFRSVWEKGHPGFIFAVAAHLFALLVQDTDQVTAERALKDSIKWREDDSFGEGQTWHSLGNLLSRDRRRWREAQDAYRKSIKLFKGDPRGESQTWHSLGNLLSKDRQRWNEAEEAYRKSLTLRKGDTFGEAQTWHSLGNLLSKDRYRWNEAEEAYRKSLALRKGDTYGEAQTWHSIGNLLSKERRRWREAEDAFRKSIEVDTSPNSQAQTWHSLGNLLSKDRLKWGEAEEAFRKSLELDSIPRSQAQTWHSLGNLLSKERMRWGDAEEALRKSIELSDRDLRTKAGAWTSLGNLLSKAAQRWHEAEEAYEKAFALDPNPFGKAKVLSSWAKALSRFDDAESQRRAEDLVFESFKFDPKNPQTRSFGYRILADIYERRGELGRAIEALRAKLEADQKSGDRQFSRETQARIAELQRRRQKSGDDL